LKDEKCALSPYGDQGVRGNKCWSVGVLKCLPQGAMAQKAHTVFYKKAQNHIKNAFFIKTYKIY
jgi:hypothetical protein